MYIKKVGREVIKMKMIKILFSMIIALTIYKGEKVNAYVFPENDYYIILDVQTLGTIKVHIPKDKMEFLQISKDLNDVCNISSGSVYGYLHYDNKEYRITFNAFGNNTYRDMSSSYSTSNIDLVVNQIIETNIPHLKVEKTIEDYVEINYEKYMFILVISCLFMGVIAWLRH